MRIVQLSLIAPVLMLAACAGRTPPPAITYDKADFKPAVISPPAIKPVKIVTIPELLPLPGQLQPPPRLATAPDKTRPADRVDLANRKALQEPTRHGYINAVQVYPYTDGALYRLYAAPEQVTDIALQPGESLGSIAAGDTVRWVVGDTTSGAGAAKRVHVLVKPIAAGLKTNLIIMTDRRAYHLELESTEHTAMSAISWDYPEDDLIALRQQNAKAEATAPIAENVALGDLHFRYAISGDRPPWAPVRAFDDGTHVYIEFPARIDQGEAPPLFVVDPKGDDALVNYRVRGRYYIVDRLFAAAELRLGETPQQVVRITRTDGVTTGDMGQGGGT